MNQSNATTQDRRNARFIADWTRCLPAKLTIGIDESARSFTANVADISLGGCAVRADLPHGLNPQVAVIRIYDQDGQVIIEAAGRTCWSRQTSVTTRTIGLRFRRAIPADLLGQLVQEGRISRREDERQVVNAKVTVRRTSGLPVVSQAILFDRSRSGVQLETDQPLKIGERVLVTLESGLSGAVGIVWSRASGNRYESGAVFQNLASSRAIFDADLLTSQDDRQELAVVGS